VIDGPSVVAAGTLAGRLITRRRVVRRNLFALDTPRATDAEALRVVGRTTLRRPDSLPNPALPAGTDTMPEIGHVFVLVLENHSYDNFLGMLGRGPGQRSRGDGFTLASDGLPTATNPYPDGQPQRAFRMPTTVPAACQAEQLVVKAAAPVRPISFVGSAGSR
jgi:phospholipase C